jgi:predicted small lipoprotein YifL
MLHSKDLNQTVILIVKSSSAFYIGTAIVVSSVLAGCGQPGPLYLPKPPAAKGPVEPAPVPPPPVIVPAT